MTIRFRTLVSVGLSTLVFGLLTVGCKEQPIASEERVEEKNEIHKTDADKDDTDKNDSDKRDDDYDDDYDDDDDDDDAFSASTVLKPIKDSKVTGKVTFKVVDDGVKIVADIEGLTPGKHGIHIHEKGDCSNDGAAAGGHFNPTKTKHGGPDSAERHVGDLGNVVADEKGKAHYERVDKVITLTGDYSIIGRSVIVHSKEDDLKTDPSGDSGDRIACGIIEEDDED